MHRPVLLTSYVSSQFANALAALERIASFLRTGSLQPVSSSANWRSAQHGPQYSGALRELQLHPGFTFKAIPHFEITGGSVVAVEGKSGSGKTTFLNLLAQDALASSIPFGFLDQQPWLMNGLSIKENIVFGQPWDEPHYRRILQGTQLEGDLIRLLSALESNCLVAKCNE